MWIRIQIRNTGKRIYTCAVKKFGINGQLRNKLFLIVIHCFSLLKAAMNALRICKMRNDDNKTHQFLNPSAQ
jgi:hypothetical protein